MEIPFERLAAAIAILGGVESEEELRATVKNQTDDRGVADRMCAEFSKLSQICKGLPCDLVEVTRCKDCKHWMVDAYGNPWCDMWEDYQYHEDVFCYYGERRGDHAETD